MIPFIILLIYIIYIIAKYGVPRSISQIYYLTKHKWIFRLVLILFVASTMPIMLANYPYQFLSFLMGAGVLFVATAPNFEDDSLVDSVHTYSAIISLVSSQIWVGLIHPISLCLWIPFFIYLLYQYKSLDTSNYKFYGEIIMLLTVYSILL